MWRFLDGPGGTRRSPGAPHATISLGPPPGAAYPRNLLGLAPRGKSSREVPTNPRPPKGEPRPTPPDPDVGTASTWLRYSHLGTQFALTITLLALAGVWADRRFATGPWLTIAGSLVGITSALWLLIRAVR